MGESRSSGELFCRLFDPADTGYVAVSMFRQILRTKHVSVSDITDMVEGKTRELKIVNLNCIPEYRHGLQQNELNTSSSTLFLF